MGKATYVRCTNCAHRVRIPVGFPAPRGRCPKCLGAVRIPAELQATVQKATPPARQPEPQGPGDLVHQVAKVPLALMHAMHGLAWLTALSWTPILFDPAGMGHLKPGATLLLVFVGIGLIAFKLLMLRERLSLHQREMHLGDRVVRWADVEAVQEEEVDGERVILVHTRQGETVTIGHRFCLGAEHHWVRLLFPEYRGECADEIVKTINILRSDVPVVPRKKKRMIIGTAPTASGNGPMPAGAC